jgi:hypothetical protein
VPVPVNGFGTANAKSVSVIVPAVLITGADEGALGCTVVFATMPSAVCRFTFASTR